MRPVQAARSAVDRYGLIEAARRAPGGLSRRARRSLARARHARALRTNAFTDRANRSIITQGRLALSDVFVIKDEKFGAQVVRKDTTDWATYNQIFVREDYKFRHSVAPQTIIDLGANVGYASVWYHAYFPTARIVAVEPDSANVQTARVNFELACREGGRLEIEETAIWHSESHVKLVNPAGTAWGFKVYEAEPEEPGAFPATTMAAIMQRHGMDTVDLVKIDIEGGERYLFAKNTEWLDRVNALVIELHDRKIPGCREPVVAALDRHFIDYDEVVRGENTLFTRRRRLDEGPPAE